MLGDPRLDNVTVTQPLVTVVVTNYNYEKFIYACLESIARQTYRSFKCLVVDDCSSDSSPQIVTEFVASQLADGRFSLIRHEENLGQMGGFLTGLQHAEGPFIVYVDADDLLLEDFLAVHVDVHAGRCEPVAFTSSNQYQINGNGEVLGGTHPDLRAKGHFRYVTSRSIHEPFWVWATTSSMMFRKSVLDLLVDSESGKFRICADNYICHFANLIGGSLIIPTKLGCYRRHGRNNFSMNSMVGGCHPTGNMADHPKHHEVRFLIFFELCRKHDQLVRLLSKKRYFALIAKTIGPFETLKSYFMLPKGTPLLYLFVVSLLIRIRQMVIRFRSIMRRDIDSFDFGEDAILLKLPGE